MYRCRYCLSVLSEFTIHQRLPGHVQTVLSHYYDSTGPVRVSPGSYRASLISPDCLGGWFDECYLYSMDSAGDSLPSNAYFVSKE